eukprot:gb/GECG01008319.1/.p1 GENE.gb/GECG01008319.1/~~gb/GECG01008319.1/.p1  ORF type:complete len:419 (+),score=64.50 gb/GECG01008319.1/:1-1257(+)
MKMSQEVLQSILKTSLRASGHDNPEEMAQAAVSGDQQAANTAASSAEPMSQERQAFLRGALESLGDEEAKTLEKAHATLESLVKYLYENRSSVGMGAILPQQDKQEPSEDAPAVPAAAGGGDTTHHRGAVPTVGQALEACDEVCEFVETIDSSLGWLHSGGMALLQLLLGVKGVDTSAECPIPEGMARATQSSSKLDGRVLSGICRILQCASQNNEQAQQELVQAGVLRQTIRLLDEAITAAENNGVNHASFTELVRSLVGGLGSIIRSLSAAQEEFLANNGTRLLVSLLGFPANSKVEIQCLKKVTLVLLGLCKAESSTLRDRFVKQLSDSGSDKLADALAAALETEDVQVRENVSQILRSLQQNAKALELFPSICGKTPPNYALETAVKKAMEAALHDNVGLEELKASLAILRSKR